MMKWTELRAELQAKHKELTRSKLDRLLARLTRANTLGPQQQDQNSRARVLSDTDVATLTAAASDLAVHPREVPPQFRAKASPPREPASAGEDDELDVERLAKSEGPKNTRKSLTDKKPKRKVVVDDDDDGEESTKKSGWGKWALIGFGALALVGAFLFIAKRRRDAGGGGSNMPAAPAGGPAQETPSAPVNPMAMTAEEIAVYRASGLLP
jgi:hypothetical protein